MDSYHIIKIQKAFKILYRTPANQYYSTRVKHLIMALDILISFCKPELRSQKTFFIRFDFLGPVYFYCVNDFI